MGRKLLKEPPKRNINTSLFKQWCSFKRMGDAVKISKLASVSTPTIQKALNYGNVNRQEIIDIINKYFIQRERSEKLKSKKLKQNK